MIKLVLIYFFLLAAGVRGAVVHKPINIAVNVSGSSYFNCSTDSISIGWVYTVDGTVGPENGIPMTDASTCDIVSNFSGNFRTEKPITNYCNLIVFDAQLSLAGYYSCTSDFGANSGAILVVVDTRSNIISNATDEIAAGDEIVFGMTVTYSAPSLPATDPPLIYPSLNWTVQSNPNDRVPSSDAVTTTNTSSYIIVEAPIIAVPSYVCTLFFNRPTNPPQNCDNNAPSYTFSWTTPQTKTSYNEPGFTVTPYFESDICEAKILECNPNAYPPPIEVILFDVLRNEIVNGTNVTALFGEQYECSVTNTIKGTPYTASAPYTLNKISEFTKTPCKGVNRSEIHATISGSKCTAVNNNTNRYSCEGEKEVTIICQAEAIPNASYTWNDFCQTKEKTLVTEVSGSFECTAYNAVNDRRFQAIVTIEITGLPVANNITLSCDKVNPNCEAANICKSLCISDGACIALIVIVSVLVANLLFHCVFLLWYGCSRSFKQKVNDKFHWIEEALPCMNKKGCECSWELVFFICSSVIGGIIFIPYVIIASLCCQNSTKRSQDSELRPVVRSTNGSGRQQPHKTSSSPDQPPPPPPPQNPTRQTRGDPYPNAQANSHHSRAPQNQGAPSSPSPVSTEGVVVYSDLPLRVDSRPGSRKPVEMIVPSNDGTYAELQRT